MKFVHSVVAALLLVLCSVGIAQAASPARLTILSYHEVAEGDAALVPMYTVTPTNFVRQLDWLKNNGYHFVSMRFEPAAIEVLDVITPVSLEHSIIALVGTSALLLLWSLLPSRGVTHAHAVQGLDDYSDYFDLDAGEIIAGRESRVCVVHHDDHGNIVGIEPRAG